MIRSLVMGGFDPLPPPNTLNTKLAHQAGDIDLLPLHRMPQLTRAINGAVLLPNVLHLLAQKSIPPGPTRSPVRITLDGQMRIECRRGDLKHPPSGHCSAMPCRAVDPQAVPAAPNRLRNRQDFRRSARVFLSRDPKPSAPLGRAAPLDTVLRSSSFPWPGIRPSGAAANRGAVQSAKGLGSR